MTITLYYNQLSHTIEQILHRAGSAVNDAYQRYLIQMDDSTSDQQLIRRLIRTGLAKEKTWLRDYLSEKQDAGNDMLRQTEGSWTISLSLNGDGQAMADLLHWYIAWSALADIYKTFGFTELANSAAADAAEAEDLLKSELMTAAMPIKRRRPEPCPQAFAPKINLISLQ